VIGSMGGRTPLDGVCVVIEGVGGTNCEIGGGGGLSPKSKY